MLKLALLPCPWCLFDAVQRLRILLSRAPANLGTVLRFGPVRAHSGVWHTVCARVGLERLYLLQHLGIGVDSIEDIEHLELEFARV